MPTAFRFFHLLLSFPLAVMVCSVNLPLAAGQGDAPKSDKPTADKPTPLGLVADGPAADRDSPQKESRDNADNKQAEKSDTRKKSGAEEKSDTERRGTEKGRTEKGRTEKRAAKAQRGPSAKSADGPGSSAAAPRRVAEAEREAAALALVREHHPALVELLERLKATKKADYQQAIKELYRDSQRLAAARQRDAERYALDLRAWQLDSRIRLLTAQLSLEDRTELEEQLKICLTERAAVRLSLKTLERDRAQARAKRLDEEIAKLTAGQEAEVRRSLERLLRAAKRAAAGRRKEEKKAAEVAREARPKAEDAARVQAPRNTIPADRPLAADAKNEPSAP